MASLPVVIPAFRSERTIRRCLELFAEEAPAGWQRVAGTIVHLEMLGPLTRLDVRLANGTILRAAILDAPQRVLAEGQAASLAFDATQLTVVP